MASPPFSIAETVPEDDDIVSQFPALDRTFRDVVESWLLVGHDTSGRHTNVPPVGVVFDYAGGTAPSGYVFCYGQALSRTTYSALFTAIGTAHGAGDGVNTFNVPDCRGRVSAGKDDMGGSSANRLTNQTGGLDGDTLGATGGAETHVLLEAQLAAHTHGDGTLTVDDHFHYVASANTTGDALSGGNHVAEHGTSSFDDEYELKGASNNPSQGRSSEEGAGISGSTGSTGSNTAHNNVQPTIVMNKIIFTGVYS